MGFGEGAGWFWVFRWWNGGLATDGQAPIVGVHAIGRNFGDDRCLDESLRRMTSVGFTLIC